MYSLDFPHPVTKEYIPLFSDYVYELLSRGYTLNDIMFLSKQPNPKYNRNNVFSNDLLYNYMLHLDIKNIKSLCMIDKKAVDLWNNRQFWKDKIIKDNCININLFSLFQLKKYDESAYKKFSKDMEVIHKIKTESLTVGKGFRFKQEDLTSVLSVVVTKYIKNVFTLQIIVFYKNIINIYLANKEMGETYTITSDYYIYEMIIKIYTLYKKVFEKNMDDEYSNIF